MRVDKNKALKVLAEVVAGNEHRTVNRCFYTDSADRSKPNCLVAHFLFRLDPDIINRIYEANLDAALINTVASRDAVMGDIKLSKAAIEILAIAQDVQDGRAMGRDHTWGSALEAARQVAAVV